MFDMDKIKWGIDELLPCIVQDFESKEVLMLAFMDSKALKLSMDSGIAHYFSRSKKRIWKKGESSNNIQEIKKIMLDCDNDTILIFVKQNGVACHTGRFSCFFKTLDKQEKSSFNMKQNEIDFSLKSYGVIDTLYHVLLEKKIQDPNSSYTANLIQKGINNVLKKIIEETGEFCLAFKDDEEKNIVYEGADLIYHLLVALAFKEINPDMILSELKRRMGTSGLIEKKLRKEK